MLDVVRHRPILIAFGEALFDELPTGKVLGGAPLNFAVHATQLGVNACLWTALGQDEDARQCLTSLQARQVDCSEISQHEDYSTGRVKVDFNEDQEPIYEICNHVAWDFIQSSSSIYDKIQNCDAFYFGSLAVRNRHNRLLLADTWDYIAHLNGKKPLIFFDLNLRRPFIDWTWIKQAFMVCDLLKINAAEWEAIQQQHTHEKNAEAFMQHYHIKYVVITRGALGCCVLTDGQSYEGAPVTKQSGGDAVGAGDACAAAILYGILNGLDLQETVNIANQVGAFVASQTGATPLGVEQFI